MKILVLIVLLLPVVSRADIKFLTYNTGLYHDYVPYAKERKPEILNTLSQYDGDVICLQEVWKKKDRKDFIKKLKSKFPYVFAPKAKQKKTSWGPACGRKDLFGENKIVTCFNKKCGGKEGDEFTQCVLQDCERPLKNLREKNNECAQALFAQVGVNPLLGIIRLRNPVIRAGLFSNKGSEGTMIFSKHPFVKGSKVHVDMADKSTLTHRGILNAKVNIEGKEFLVSCNHTTANLDGEVPYPGPYQSYEEENLDQTRQVIEVASSLGENLPKIVMGDFNMGPTCSGRGIRGDFEFNYDEFERNGYDNPILRAPDVTCSNCGDNTLNRGDAKPILIDHIFVKDIPGYEASARMMYTEEVSIRINQKKFFDYFRLKRNRPKDKIIKSNLSDHFGIEVTLTPKS